MDMFSLSKRRILTTALKFRYREARRIKWWLKGASLIPLAQYVTGAVKEITNNAIPSNIYIFKLNEQKVVFRAEYSQDRRQSFVAKIFLLNRFEHRFKYHKYGLDETTNLLRAKDMGINTPEVYGYGHINDLVGLVKVSVVILEDLHGLSPIGALMAAKSEDECSRMFMRTVPLFVSIYNAGCNHIDVNSGAVMLCEGNISPAVFLLDFQHAKFYDKPSTEILMFEAGHFARSCHDWVSTRTINEWLDKLLTAVAISRIAERQKMIERFNYYFGTCLSRKERKKIR